jgi:pyrroline-5-carboxylate reductase
MKTLNTPILSIGCGNMAHAILQGAQAAGVLSSELIAVLDPNPDRRVLFNTAFETHHDAAEWLNTTGAHRPLILLAVKPQMLREAVLPLTQAMGINSCPPCTWVSILAGTRSSTLQSLVRNDDRVVRVMPNTPAQLGLGMSAIAEENTQDPDDLNLVRTLFQSVGEVIEIPETLMDAFTAVAGSGPAYLFYLAEAMMRAAESIGFSTEQSNAIVRQTITGSAQLLAEASSTPSELRAKVTSKNGTTYAATTTLDQRGTMDAVIAALTAARDRGIELAEA